MKWSAIDFDEDTITISETRVKFTANEITKKPKSDSSYRTLPLTSDMKGFLKKLRIKQKNNKNYYKDSYYDGDYVCCLKDGTPLKPDYLNHTFKKILNKNNLPLIRFHDLRHSTATLLISKGENLKLVQAWLRHADISTTANIYGHVDIASKKNTASE